MGRENFKYETKSMILYILNGHSLTETAKEHGATTNLVRSRLKRAGLSYADLVEYRKKRKSQKG